MLCFKSCERLLTGEWHLKEHSNIERLVTLLLMYLKQNNWLYSLSRRFRFHGKLRHSGEGFLETHEVNSQ